MYKAVYEIWKKGVSASERAELDAIADNDLEIKERFAVELQFGTAGMRGTVGLGTNRINIYSVRRATAGLAEYIVSLNAEAKGVVIAYDTRRFSREFAKVVAEVLGGYSIKAYLFEDVRPVPICSFAIRHLGAAAGVMITASHNPKEYNGYKVYGADGAQMSPEATAEVVKYIKEKKDYFSLPRLEIKEDFKGLDNYPLNEFVTVIGSAVDQVYYNTIQKLSLSPEVTARLGKSIKLVYTPVHGSGYIPVTTIFERIGISAHIVEEQAHPDTEFSTVIAPNPENTDTLRLGIAKGNEIGADVVLATDPDCDRLGAAVRSAGGEFILLTGNQIAVLLLDYICLRLKERGELPKNGAIIKSFVTTTLADRLAESYGIKVFNVPTGFKFIGEKIKEWEQSGEYEYIFGFEESYGSLRGTHARDKDAVVASMLFAEMFLHHASKGQSVLGRLNQIFEEFGYYAENNIALEYKGLNGMAVMAGVMSALRKKTIAEFAEEKVVSTTDYKYGIVKYPSGEAGTTDLSPSDTLYFTLEDKQFVCIRPSGTEPKLKIYVLVYSDSEKNASEKAERIMNAAKMELK
ncbi:MAG: phospho-sugar mutase [Clostridia bacterium]